MQNLDIVYRKTSKLKERANNPRTHSKRQIEQIAESIDAFGFTNPILIDRRKEIIAGHGRLAAAKLLGLEKVPTIRLEELTPEQIRAYIIADNRLAEKAGWDEEILAIEFQDLMVLDLGFDITVTGFELPEIDILLDGLANDDEEPEEATPIDRSDPPVTQTGDLWIIGDHRLLCGDATEPHSYERLLEGEKAQMVFTDPPYNFPIEGNVSGKGAVKHQDFVMASGEMSEEEFAEFLKASLGNMAVNSCNGAIHFVCMDWRHIPETLASGFAVYHDFKNICVWAKTNAGLGSFYRSQHEFVLVFQYGTARYINNIELGRHGRNRSNLWTYPGISGFSKTRNQDQKLHPTVKPLAMVADAIRDCSHREGLILDAFAGSGTTLLAAHQTGRRGYGIELDPHYCDAIVRRLQSQSGLEAIHAETGEPFRRPQELSSKRTVK